MICKFCKVGTGVLDLLLQPWILRLSETQFLLKRELGRQQLPEQPIAIADIEERLWLSNPSQYDTIYVIEKALLPFAAFWISIIQKLTEYHTNLSKIHCLRESAPMQEVDTPNRGDEDLRPVINQQPIARRLEV